MNSLVRKMCRARIEGILAQSALSEKYVINVIYECRLDELKELLGLSGFTNSDIEMCWELLDDYCINEGLYDKYGFKLEDEEEA